MEKTEKALLNGVYKSESATYFVKDGKIMMKLGGNYYQTTTNFMLGAVFTRDLTPGQIEDFDNAYNKCKRW